MRRRRPAEPSPLELALGTASLGIGMVGMVAPRFVAGLMRIDRSAVWLLAVRDVASAWLLLGWGGRPAFLSRAIFDLGDGVLMLRRRPALAGLAFASALVGLAGSTQRRTAR